MPSLACRVGQPLLLEICLRLVERVVSYVCINGTRIAWLSSTAVL